MDIGSQRAFRENRVRSRIKKGFQVRVSVHNINNKECFVYCFEMDNQQENSYGYQDYDQVLDG